jgi:hypothetical protein
MTLKTWEQLERLARRDFEAVRGTVIETRVIWGYAPDDPAGDYQDPNDSLLLDEPFRVRVVGLELYDCQDWLEPTWEVELVEPHPRLSRWEELEVHGTDYCLDGRWERLNLATGEPVHGSLD